MSKIAQASGKAAPNKDGGARTNEEGENGMGKVKWGARGGLLALLGLVAVVAASAQAPPKGAKETVKSRVVVATKQKEDVVEKFLRALGPAVCEQLRSGESVELPGLGTFRVVQVAAHRDLQGGRPVSVPAANYIEFLPSGELNGAANAPGAVPGRVVPGFEYVPNPRHVPSDKTDYLRMPGRIRTR